MKITHLILIAVASTFASQASAQSPIYKCIVKGKTIYSESPCTIGTTKQTELAIDNSRMGNVTYDRQTIEAARSRIRDRMNQPGAIGTSTGAAKPTGDKKLVCDAAKLDMDNLDAMARQPNTGYAQDQIKQRKVEVQKTAYEWKC